MFDAIAGRDHRPSQPVADDFAAGISLRDQNNGTVMPWRK
jgi:hypothetical protein